MRNAESRKLYGLKVVLCLLAVAVLSSCGLTGAETKNTPVEVPKKSKRFSTATPVAELELVDKRNSTTQSPLGKFDFRNFTYPLPRGWQDADGADLELVNGERRTTEEKIGMRYLTTKYFDATGDGEDEAFVILSIGTGGSAIPHIVYVYQWKDDKPDLIWYFRTGDRADGGLKNIYPEDGLVAIELFGKDRWIFGEMETLRITSDEVQLCCPTHYTKSRYKWKNGSFSIDGDRLTFPMGKSDAEPEVNLGNKEAEEGESRK